MLNDYKGLKLIASSNPHIRNNEDTRSIMLDVIIALCPALIMSVIRFGFRALISVLVSVVSAMFFEWLYRKLMHKTQTLGDLSAAVTGVLLAFVCPVTLPYWMLIVGNFFAIFLVKQLYGGLGKNFLNPALAGRAALVACYTSQMTSWIDPASGKAPLFGGADVVTAATPLAMMKGGEFAEVTAQYSLSDMFIGNIGGSLGEISAMMLLIGGLYLIFRKVISWQIPVAYIGTVAVLTFLFPQGNDAMSWMLYNVLGGGLFLGAFFMATDYVTSPVTKKGQLIFGIDCVAMCVNDVICAGAKPLVFLDYIACGRNIPEKIAEIVKGVAEGCVQADCSLVGGETAEHPGMMPEDEYDLAGFTVGVVDKEKILSNETMKPGDVILALPSTGVHSNGFSLVRKIFDIDNDPDVLKTAPAELGGKTLGEALLAPTKIYVKPVLKVLEEVDVKGISHITGGGFYENIPRSLKKGCCARIRKADVRTPALFHLMEKVGGISEHDMFNTFNMGVGMVLTVPAEQADKALDILHANGEPETYRLGVIAEGEGVELC